ncbi:MAG: hypothetical protein JWM19_7305 [Actinomycetia bacterium]|nr:hypothetical protein [Actinomycetes bacterium]
MPFWMVIAPTHPADAFFELAVDALAGKLSAAAARAFLGGPAERALRDVFATAIDTVIAQIAGEPNGATAMPDALSKLRDSLRARRKAFTRPRQFQDLPGLVNAWIEAVEGDVGSKRLRALGVRREWLASTLCTEIASGIKVNALEGGPLQPLATDTDLRKVLGHLQEALASLAGLTDKVDGLQHLVEQQAGRAARPEAGYGARTVIEARTAGFTGREHFISKIDGLLKGNPAFPSGYVLIVGEPGIGKTTLLSHLIEARGYVHHMNNRRQGITSAQAFLRDICDQLADRCGLPRPSDPDSSTLSMLLHQAARTASPEKPLVIAIDALDESDLPASLSANRLLLPPVLPPSVYFLITSRPQRDYQLSVEPPPAVIAIGDDDPSNLLDIRRYINKQLNDYPADFARRIEAWEVSRAEFIDTLVTMSQGNFLYIFHVLTSIRLDRLSRAALDDIKKLPKGLSGYYGYHWDVMAELWPEELCLKHKAAVRCMAAINEPISVRNLVQTAGEENLPGVDDELARTIFDAWREFFNSELDRDTDEELLYVYHETFRKFLDDSESLAPLEYKLRRRQSMLLHQHLERYS